MSVYVPPALTRAFFKAFGLWVFAPNTAWPELRTRFDSLGLLSLWSGVHAESTELGGVPADLLTPPNVEPGRVLLFLHGGGFVVGSPMTHRALAARLATKLNAVAYVLDYRLAPEHPYPAAFDDTMSAYRALLAAGWNPSEIFVAGDSAGGGLSLALGVEAVRQGLPVPAGLGLLVPGVELTAAAMDRYPHGGLEPILTVDLLDRFFNAYLSKCADRSIPAASPLLADLRGLPPLVIDTAEHCPLRNQAIRLARRAREAGVPVRYREEPGLSHGFHSGAGLLLQADQALDGVAAALLDAQASRSAIGGSGAA